MYNITQLFSNIKKIRPTKKQKKYVGAILGKDGIRKTWGYDRDRRLFHNSFAFLTVGKGNLKKKNILGGFHYVPCGLFVPVCAVVRFVRQKTRGS
jgi:hypothetical protein